MDTTSKTTTRRSFAKLVGGGIAAIALTGMVSNSASAENAGVKVIGHTLVSHSNGVWTLGEVTAFTIDSASGRSIDESTRSVRDTGMIVDLPKELGK